MTDEQLSEAVTKLVNLWLATIEKLGDELDDHLLAMRIYWSAAVTFSNMIEKEVMARGGKVIAKRMGSDSDDIEPGTN